MINDYTIFGVRRLMYNLYELAEIYRSIYRATSCIETELRTVYEWVLIFDRRNDPAQYNNHVH